MLKLHDPEQVMVGRRKPKIPEANKWTIVARGKDNVGHRYMIEAVNFVQAMSSGAQLCKLRGVIFVGAFAGHMHALEVVSEIK